MKLPELRIVSAENELEVVAGGLSGDIQHDPLQSSRFTRVPPGEYLVEFTEYWIVETYRRITWVVEFVIDRGPLGESELDLAGYKVRRYATPPRPTKYPSRRSSFAKDFIQIIGLSPPEFLHTLTPFDIYANCILKARIGDVDTDEDRDLVPEGARYSLVRKIIGRVEGVPPYLQRRRGQADG